MLHRHGPTAVGIVTAGLVEVAQAELQLTSRVAVEAANVEVVAGDVVLLEHAVLAREGIAVLQPANLHVLHAGTGGALVPVVEVGDMDVVALVEAPPGPQRAVVQRRHLAPLGIGLHHPRPAVIAGELRGVVVLVVERRHAFQAQYRAVGEGVEVLTQIELGVLLALVTQAVLGRRAGQLEAGLRIAVDRFADPAAHVAGELQCMGAHRQRQTRNGAGNAQGC